MMNRLAELFLKDFWLKLFSLALALLIWFTIFQAIKQQGSPVSASNENIKQRTLYNLPVVKVSSSSDVSDVRISPTEVQVTVQGDAPSVVSLPDQDIKVRVDLSDLVPGRKLRKPVEVSAPAGITYVSIDPAEVEVVLPPKPPTASK